MPVFNLDNTNNTWEAFQQGAAFSPNTINGGDGNDFIVSGTMNDVVNGGNDNDVLFGISGSDVLNGDAGNDSLDGGNGSDTLNGGAGNDTYVLEFRADEVGQEQIIDSDGNGVLFIGSTAFDMNTGQTTTTGYTLTGTAKLVSGETTIYSFVIADDQGVNQTYRFQWAGDVNDANSTANLKIWNTAVSDAQSAAFVQNFKNGTFGITLTDNFAPVAQDDSANTNEDESVLINVLGNDSDADGSVDVTTVIASDPTHGAVAVNSTTGEITYTPDADYNGADSFTYTVKDNQGKISNVATVNVTVGDANDAPVANTDSANVKDNASVVINVLSNDTDADGTVDATSVVAGTAANGTVSVNGTTGAITYTPTTWYVGSDSFTYTVKDNNGQVSNAATVNVTVQDSTFNLTGDADFFEPHSIGQAGRALKVNGLNGDDYIVTSSNKDSVTGGEGNDKMFTSAGDDTVLGGAGADTIDASSGANVVKGGSGNDTFIVEFTDAGSTQITDEDSTSVIFVGSQNQQTSALVGYTLTGIAAKTATNTYTLTLDGKTFTLNWAGNANNPASAADLTITEQGDGKPHSVVVKNFLNNNFGLTLEAPLPSANEGTNGNDSFQATNGNDVIDAKAGDDSIHGAKGDDSINGGSGNDTLQGGEGNDTVNGDSGNDLLKGYLGDDVLNGGAGNDDVAGGEGNDTLTGGAGNDVLAGNVGNDSVDGGSGNDLLTGFDGNDMLDGATGNDTLQGGTGNDWLSGGAGNDLLQGQVGDDTIDGGAGNDLIEGNAGNDSLMGGVGNDTITGSTGNDVMQGGSGNDNLKGGTGADTLTGGAGRDVFVFSNEDHSTGAAADRITDFQKGQDIIDLSAMDFTALGNGTGSTLVAYNVGETTHLANADTGFYLVLDTKLTLVTADIWF